MSITIICVGKLKEKPLRALCDEYLKRLSRYTKIDEAELPDLPERENASAKEQEALIFHEGQKIMSRIGPRDYVIALCIEGRMLDSVALSRHMETLKAKGESSLVFVIGGSLGLSNEVKNRANETLSMSPMTFPHGLARLMLLEQLYRAHKVTAGERYHK